jgi:farnesyl-diphosphate farnesyltransferase
VTPSRTVANTPERIPRSIADDRPAPGTTVESRGLPDTATLFSLLKQVSRSFYLTLRILPAEVRSQIGVAYLLARATDTVADTRVVPVESRLATLSALRARILGQTAEPLSLNVFAEPGSAESTACDVQIGAPPSAAEHLLLQRIEEFLGCLRAFSETDHRLIRTVLSTIISGQELDLQRFGRTGPNQIVALANEQELDDYIFRVAGCVGEFWTRLCRVHLFPAAPLDENLLIQNGIRFGKGLQLVNVLRDLPTDLRHGRCYLPGDRLAALGLKPLDLLDMSNYERFRPFFDFLLKVAEGHLTAGWQYTNSLPRHCRRLRLACAWPILIGIATLSKLRRTNILDSLRRVKVTRVEVRRIIARSLLGQIWPPLWDRLFTRAKLV